MNSELEPAVCRYTQTGEDWALSVFVPDPARYNVVRTLTGAHLGTRPEWLQNIISVATVAERVQQVPKPPPSYILWFEMNERNELTGFPPLNFLSNP